MDTMLILIGLLAIAIGLCYIALHAFEHEDEPVLMQAEAHLASAEPQPIVVNVHIHNAPVEVDALAEIIRSATQQSKSKPTP